MKTTTYTWDTLPLGKYLTLLERLDLQSDDIITDCENSVRMLAVLYDMTEEQVEALPLTDYQAMMAACEFLHQPRPEAKAENIKTPIFAENYELDAVTAPEDMTTAQYIDFQTLARSEKHDLVALLSCFLIPKGCKYNTGYDLGKVRAAIANTVSVAAADSLTAFFLHRFEASIDCTLNSLVSMKTHRKSKKLMKAVSIVRSNLRKLGAGLRMSTR